MTADQLRLREVGGTWVIRAGGAVIGESKKVLELTRGNDDPVIYFPRSDIAMAFLEQGDKHATFPQIGRASHFTIVAKSGPIADAAWSFETPSAGMEAIAGHLAFHPDKVTVERL